VVWHSVATLRDLGGAPLEYDRKAGGWRYDQRSGTRSFELPGPWFSDAERDASLHVPQSLAEIPPGLLHRARPNTAVLYVSAERSRQVAEEQWRPRPSDALLPDGRYERHTPYGDSRELLMNILRRGPQVEVVAQSDLRAAVQHLLA